MDHSLSLNSSMAKAAASAKQDLIVCPDEESGWTSYFEDFSSNTNSSCFSLGGGGSSSLVSDAASCAACKFSHHNKYLLSSFSSDNGVAPNLPDMKLGFKKTRTKQISEDDPLEDTASSPLNSPKVGELNPTERISRRTADQLYDDSMGKGFTSGHNSELKRDDDHNKDDKNFNGKSNIDYTDLKKRGLCLVPLSMLVNYFG